LFFISEVYDFNKQWDYEPYAERCCLQKQRRGRKVGLFLSIKSNRQLLPERR